MARQRYDVRSSARGAATAMLLARQGLSVLAVTVDLGHAVLSGRFPAIDGADSLYSPRRTVLDTILVEAARQAGAEVRQDYLVEELEFRDGRVVGFAGRPRHGTRVVDLAGLVIGADGKNSLVARSVNAQRPRRAPPRRRPPSTGGRVAGGYG